MLSRFLLSLVVSALVFAAAIAVLRLGQAVWYGRVPVEEGFAAYQEGDYDRALPIVRAHALWGDPGAQTYLSLHYGSGNATVRSGWLSYFWLRRAVSQDYPDALVLLARRYQFGAFVEEDLVKARDYYLMAAESGHPDGFAGLAYLHLIEPYKYDTDLMSEAVRTGDGPEEIDRSGENDGQDPIADRRDARLARWQLFERQGRQYLESAIAADSILGHAIHCFSEIEHPLVLRPSAISSSTLHSCMQAGFGGYDGYLARAVSILTNVDSPYRDFGKAYELTVIDNMWWPTNHTKWEGSLALFLCGAAIDPMPHCQATPEYDDEPSELGRYRAYELESNTDANYQGLYSTIAERFWSFRFHPTTQLDPPSFGPDFAQHIDEDSLLRAETAARAFLAENPRPPSHLQWMQH